MKKLIFLLLAAVLVFSGCTKYSKCSKIGLESIKLESVKLESFKLHPPSKADVILSVFVDNPIKGTIMLNELDGVVYKEGTEFAKIVMVKPVELRQGNPAEVKVPLEVELLNPLGALVMGLSPAGRNLDHYTTDVEVKAKKGLVVMKFELENIPLKDIVGGLNDQL